MSTASPASSTTVMSSPTLKVPTLVVVGRFDVICGVRWGEELTDYQPNVR